MYSTSAQKRALRAWMDRVGMAVIATTPFIRAKCQPSEYKFGASSCVAIPSHTLKIDHSFWAWNQYIYIVGAPTPFFKVLRQSWNWYCLKTTYRACLHLACLRPFTRSSIAPSSESSGSPSETTISFRVKDVFNGNYPITKTIIALFPTLYQLMAYLKTIVRTTYKLRIFWGLHCENFLIINRSPLRLKVFPQAWCGLPTPDQTPRDSGLTPSTFGDSLSLISSRLQMSELSQGLKHHGSCCWRSVAAFGARTIWYHIWYWIAISILHVGYHT